MTARLPTGLIASALIRRVHDAGGFAAVRAKGDPDGGALLLLALNRAGATRVFERGLGPTGEPTSIDSTPRDATADSIEIYWRRRR